MLYSEVSSHTFDTVADDSLDSLAEFFEDLPEIHQLHEDYDVLFAVSLSVQSSVRMGARCCSVVRAFTHGAMGRRIDPSWGKPIELFLVPTSAPRLV